MKRRSINIIEQRITPEMLIQIYQGNVSGISDEKLQSAFKKAIQKHINSNNKVEENFANYFSEPQTINHTIYNFQLDKEKTREYAGIISFFEQRIQEKKQKLQDSFKLLAFYKIPAIQTLKFNDFSEENCKKIITVIQSTNDSLITEGEKQSLLSSLNIKVIEQLDEVENTQLQFEIEKFTHQEQKQDKLFEDAILNTLNETSKLEILTTNKKMTNTIKITPETLIQMYQGDFSGISDETLQSELKNTIQNHIKSNNPSQKSFFAYFQSSKRIADTTFELDQERTAEYEHIASFFEQRIKLRQHLLKQEFQPLQGKFTILENYSEEYCNELNQEIERSNELVKKMQDITQQENEIKLEEEKIGKEEKKIREEEGKIREDEKKIEEIKEKFKEDEKNVQQEVGKIFANKKDITFEKRRIELGVEAIERAINNIKQEKQYIEQRKKNIEEKKKDITLRKENIEEKKKDIESEMQKLKLKYKITVIDRIKLRKANKKSYINTIIEPITPIKVISPLEETEKKTLQAKITEIQREQERIKLEEQKRLEEQRKVEDNQTSIDYSKEKYSESLKVNNLDSSIEDKQRSNVNSELKKQNSADSQSEVKTSESSKVKKTSVFMILIKKIFSFFGYKPNNKKDVIKDDKNITLISSSIQKSQSKKQLDINLANISISDFTPSTDDLQSKKSKHVKDLEAQQKRQSNKLKEMG